MHLTILHDRTVILLQAVDTKYCGWIEEIPDLPFEFKGESLEIHIPEKDAYPGWHIATKSPQEVIAHATVLQIHPSIYLSDQSQFEFHLIVIHFTDFKEIYR